MEKEVYTQLNEAFHTGLKEGIGQKLHNLIGADVDTNINAYARKYCFGSLVAKSESPDEIAIYKDPNGDSLYIAVGNVDGPVAMRLDYSKGNAYTDPLPIYL